MKITIPIEVEISLNTCIEKWERKCPTFNLGVNVPAWDSSSWRDDTLEDSIIAISNQIKNKLTSEWLAMKIYEEFSTPKGLEYSRLEILQASIIKILEMLIANEKGNPYFQESETSTIKTTLHASAESLLKELTK